MIEYIERNGIIFQVDFEHPFRRFDPVTIAIVAGTGAMAYGQYQSGKAAEAQGKAEQEIANYNAKLKEREAAAELERSRAEALRFEKEGEALLGTQKAKIAKGGVLATEGTPALLLEQTEMELEADRMSILEEGFLRKSFMESEAEGLRFSGRAAKARGKNLMSAARFKAAGTLLTGFGSAYKGIGGGGGAKGAASKANASPMKNQAASTGTAKA